MGKLTANGRLSRGKGKGKVPALTLTFATELGAVSLHGIANSSVLEGGQVLLTRCSFWLHSSSPLGSQR